MEHQTLEKLQVVAEVDRDYSHCPMTRNERLERWAQLLERDPGRRLSTLRETEYQPEEVRARLRAEGTAITVAFQDDVLRDAGLKDDSYGEARRFFELTNEQLHEVTCYCHLGNSVNAGTAARHVRAVLAGTRPGMFARIQGAFIG